MIKNLGPRKYRVRQRLSKKNPKKKYRGDAYYMFALVVVLFCGGFLGYLTIKQAAPGYVLLREARDMSHERKAARNLKFAEAGIIISAADSNANIIKWGTLIVAGILVFTIIVRSIARSMIE